MAALSRVQGRDWIQEAYETGDPAIRKRTSALKSKGYRAKSFPMGNQITQWGHVKMTMVDIRPGTSGDAYLENVPRANPAKRIMGYSNPRRPPGYGSIKGAERQWKRQTASHVAGKRSKSRGTHKYFREGFAAADRQEQEAIRKKREGNPRRKTRGACVFCGKGMHVPAGEERACKRCAKRFDRQQAEQYHAAKARGAGPNWPAANPLPVGKYVTVKAKRLPNGRVELRGIR